MTEKQRCKVINDNMRGAADIAKQLGKNFSPAEKTVIFLYLFNMFNDRSVYNRDISEFNSSYGDENLAFLVSGMKRLGERVNERKIARICNALTVTFADEVSDLQRKADAVNRRS